MGNLAWRLKNPLQIDAIVAAGPALLVSLELDVVKHLETAVKLLCQHHIGHFQARSGQADALKLSLPTHDQRTSAKMVKV